MKKKIATYPMTIWAVLLVVTAVGAYFRLAGLGEGGVPGDELEIWNFCASGLSAWQILSGEMERTMMYAFPAWIKACQDLFGQTLSPFSLRFPGVLMGIATIPLIFLCGKHLFGKWGGLVAALLMAFNAVHIQCSREAYPYVMGVFGSSLNLWAILSATEDQGKGRRIAILSYVALVCGLALMIHSSIASWPAAVVEAAIFLGIQSYFAFKRRKFVGPVVAVVIILVICGPKIFAYVLQSLQRGSSKYAQATYHAAPPLLDPKGLTSLYNFAFGNTTIGLVFVAILIVAAITSIKIRKNRGLLLILVGLFVAGFVATMVSRYLSGNPFNPRFLVLLLPAYQLILCAGILTPLTFPKHRFGKSLLVTTALLIALSVLFLVRPAVYASELRGNPYDYREIVSWADRHLARGTPVLCERFFDALNEFRVNPPTNVVFTATIRNEPLEVYQKGNWRKSAIDFLTNFPDAAFYETRMFMLYQDPWGWPEKFFARNKPFIDERYVRLHALGLNYRELAKGIKVEDMSRTIHYNTIDDLMQKAVHEGVSVFVLYGQGWTYRKTNDLRDWRVMEEVSTVDVYNATRETQDVMLTITGIPPNASKGIVAEMGQQQRFSENQLSSVAFGPITLSPGKNTVTLRDPVWESRRVPLFTMKLDVESTPVTNEE